jgi:hypothetical protein
MIAFKNSDNEEEKPLKALEKLQKILDTLLDEDYDSGEDTLENSNLSELIELVYFNLFLDQNDKITISVKKNQNNSLTIKILDIE